MKKLLVLILFIFSQFVICQSDNATSTVNGGLSLNMTDTKGHPYLYNDWIKGYAVAPDGSASEQKLFKYDIFHNKLLFKLENTTSVLALDENKYSGFVLLSDSGTYTFIKIEGNSFEKNKDVSKFFQLSEAGSNELIIENIKTFKDPNESGWASSRSNNKSGSYKFNTHYYILNKDNKYSKISLSKSSILKVFKDKKDKISAYIKENNLNVKQTSDILKIVKFYHSLEN